MAVEEQPLENEVSNRHITKRNWTADPIIIGLVLAGADLIVKILTWLFPVGHG